MIKLFSSLKLFSKTVWFYTFLIFIPILRKTVFDRARNVNNFATVDGNNIISIIVITIMFLIIVFYFKTIQKALHPKIMPFAIYYFFALFSFFWTNLAYLPVITYKALEVLTSFYFVGYILYLIDDRKKILLYIILISTFITVINMISDHFSHTNTYSFTAMISILLILGGVKYQLLELKKVLFFLIISVIGILIGTSAASNLALLTGLIFLYGSGKRGTGIFKIGILIILFYFFYSAYEAEIVKIIMPNKSQEQLDNLTGRAQIWEIYWNLWLKKPFLGYGFCIGEKAAIITEWGNALTTAHNMFISILVNTGLVGIILWIRFLIVLFYRAFKGAVYGNRFGSLLFPVLVSIMINANSFPALGSEWSYVGTVCYAVVIFALWGVYPSRRELKLKKNRLYVLNNVRKNESTLG